MLVAQEFDASEIKIELPSGYVQNAVKRQLDAHICSIINSEENTFFKGNSVRGAIERLFKTSNGINGESTIQRLIEDELYRAIRNAINDYFQMNEPFREWLKQTIDAAVNSEECRERIAANVVEAIIAKSR